MAKKILVVDDDELNLKLVASMIEAQGHEVVTAINGRGALDKAVSFQPDLILLDIMLPDINGYEVCKTLKVQGETHLIPIVFITALDDRESRLAGLEAGADDFLTKPIDKSELILRVKNLLRVKDYETLLMEYNKTLEATVHERTQELEAAYIKVKSGYLDTIYRLTMAAEFKDEDTANHIKRISFYSRLLAGELKMPDSFVEIIFYSSPMHDVGKIGIPDAVLLKPGRHTPEEFEIMKTHTTIGGRILQNSDSEILIMGEVIALSHHERWDGTGYPKGLKGEDIPFAGRLVNIVDQYDAMRSHRPYKPAFSHEKTLEIITRGDSRTMPGHFDPSILEVFKKLSSEMNRIFEELAD